MIRRTDGSLTLGALHVAPDLTKSSFLGSELSQGAEVLVKHSRWVSYKLPDREAYGYPITVAIFFEDERLTSYHLCCGLPDDTGSWADWSEAREIRRQAIHDALLAQWLGEPPYRFPWGESASVFDDKAGSSYIWARFRA